MNREKEMFVREKLAEFSAIAKAKGLVTHGEITTRNSQVNASFYNKKTQAAWVEFCKEHGVQLDTDLKY